MFCPKRLFAVCATLFLLGMAPARAQIGLPMQDDGRVDYAQIFAPHQPVEIVFCLDVSGSMWQQNLPNAQARLLEIYQIACQVAGKDEQEQSNVRAGVLLYYDPQTVFFRPARFTLPDGSHRAQLSNNINQITSFVEAAKVFNIYGGNEQLGLFDGMAQTSFDWTPDVARHIFFLGNQAIRGTDYITAAQIARQGGWRVHSVLCERVSADYATSPYNEKQWIDMAWAGGGTFSCLGILPRGVEIGGPLPEIDEQIDSLNRQFNATLVPYGAQGLTQFQALVAGDETALTNDFYGQYLPRIEQKIGADLSSWEFVAALQKGVFNEQTQRELLPAGFAALDDKTRRTQALQIFKTRVAIVSQLRALFDRRTVLLRLQSQQAAIESAQARAAAQAQSEAMRAANDAARARQNRDQFAREDANKNPDFQQDSPNASQVGQRKNPNFPTENSAPWPTRAQNPNGNGDDLNQASDESNSENLATFDAPADDLARLDDEFSDAKTLKNWKNRAGQRLASDQTGIKIEKGHALLEEGSLMRAINGDFNFSVGFLNLESDQTPISCAIFPLTGASNRGARLQLDSARRLWRWTVDGKIKSSGKLGQGDRQIQMRRESKRVRIYGRPNSQQKWVLLADSQIDWLGEGARAGVLSETGNGGAVAVDWMRFRRVN